MNFENPLINTPPPESEMQQEPKDENKQHKGNSIGRWVKKTAALAGAVGVGYFGSMGDATAGDTVRAGHGTGHKQKIRETQPVQKTVESSNFMMLYKDGTSTWGVEYVNKTVEGRGILAQRFVQINDTTGEKKILGEYNNLLEASEALAKMPDVPEQVRESAKHDVDIVQTERNFQASGLTEPSGDASGKTHIEERHFTGYGLNTTNKVEVDVNGKVVHLIEPNIGEK